MAKTKDQFTKFRAHIYVSIDENHHNKLDLTIPDTEILVSFALLLVPYLIWVQMRRIHSIDNHTIITIYFVSTTGDQ